MIKVVKKFDKSNETVNEHIRNALTPIVNLIALLDNKSELDESRKKLISGMLESSKKSIEILKSLGYDMVEPEDSEYFKTMNKWNKN